MKLLFDCGDTVLLLIDSGPRLIQVQPMDGCWKLPFAALQDL